MLIQIWKDRGAEPPSKTQWAHKFKFDKLEAGQFPKEQSLGLGSSASGGPPAWGMPWRGRQGWIIIRHECVCTAVWTCLALSQPSLHTLWVECVHALKLHGTQGMEWLTANWAHHVPDPFLLLTQVVHRLRHPWSTSTGGCYWIPLNLTEWRGQVFSKRSSRSRRSSGGLGAALLHRRIPWSYSPAGTSCLSELKDMDKQWQQMLPIVRISFTFSNHNMTM